MKKILVYVLLGLTTFYIISCKKDGVSNGLTGYKDTLGVCNAKYSNGRLSTISSGPGVNATWSFEYKPQYVKAFIDSFQIEYFLSSANLPLRITRTYNGGDISEMAFFYKNGSTILDSAVSVRSRQYIIKNEYTFTYDGENIKEMKNLNFYFDGRTSIDTFSYTYRNTPNVFRSTDPLLYIYINPQADERFHNQLSYFPKIFSASTFASFSDRDGLVRKESIMNYTTDAKGRITKEWYTGFGHPYEYYYD
jgi:hypothetical protein